MGLKSKPIESVRVLALPMAEIDKGEAVRVNLNVAKVTRQKWKAFALSQDKTLSDLIHDAMAEYMQRHG